ncbi:Dolichyl-diphosphooligosaccharide--protein glycosyltransferase subunit 1 [Cytospora mali]|uniref:Dolichyl-diphosphooligosaccharide--protein glycosyltransferase subunit 1 n=1 Tax=Cytospora mali TaxID=578113 RepID=A0A194VQS5_CYTMA|nr:Dolichyl-diphosphooligosaccharide--protein glycosyltransferase subunit 1 [Valsa mali]
MRFSTLLPALASCLSLVTADSSSATTTSKISLPATFKPPQVFKNANLVHIIQLEKNYAKEIINTKIENIAKEAQDEYFLPFTPGQMSRVGAIEVKDKKNADAGPFKVEAVEFDPESTVQYYRIKFPEPLKAGEQQTLSITYYYTSAYYPLPAAIGQEDQQFLVYQTSAYTPSAYTTSKQKTEIKFSSADIPDYTKLPGSGDVSEYPQRQGSKLTYGPYDELPAGAEQPIEVRFQFTKPVIHVSDLERDIEVSHWGGNVAFEERYTMYHRGANLSSQFNRAKWQQQRYYVPTSFALSELSFPLPPSSVDPYYYDVIGNVSTSKFRSGKREALLVTKPRYPLFGGWKYPFTIGWNADAKNFLRRAVGGGYVLNVPFLEGPKQPEGIEYENIVVRVVLPEGAENLKYYTTLPPSSITSTDVEIHKTFLDTIGRTVLVIKARNLVDDLRDRELIVSYDVPLLADIRKPLVIFGSMVVTFIAAYVIGGVELKFSS